MSRREYGALALAAWLLYLALAHTQRSPGYMDASYYAAMGREMAAGGGWREPFLWQYLGDPTGLPQPAHTYWMPLASLLAAFGWLVRPDFWGARLAGLCIAGTIPPLTAYLAFALSGERTLAWMAGLLALFPPFYLPYLLTTDTFAVYMLLGGLFLLVAEKNGRWQPFGLGLLAGAMHLARADGLLWLMLAWGLVALRRRWRGLPGVGAGYLFLMLPWYVRNQVVYGRWLPPGGVRALWLLTYNDLFRYPPEALTFARWLAAGPANWLSARTWALSQNLQTFLAVQGGVVLLPFALWGAWRLRSRRVVRLGALAWGGAFGLMTLVFPWAGGRGGFFHAGAAVQPLMWALAPVGLQAFVAWGGRVRNWTPRRAEWVFAVGIGTMLLAITAVTFVQRVSTWDAAWQRDLVVEARLRALGAGPEEVVMVNDPPGYYWASGRPAVVVPVGGPEAVRAVACRYGVSYLFLEANHPPELAAWYDDPSSAIGWAWVGDVAGGRLFRVANKGGCERGGAP